MTDWPGWLETYLDQAGIRDTTTRLTRRAQRRNCTNCQEMTLAALDDTMGQILHVDAMPTTTVGELHALLAGLRTYTLIAGELCYRDHHRIAYCPADGEPVHAEHTCPGFPLPVNDKFAPRPTPTTIYDDPPF